MNEETDKNPESRTDAEKPTTPSANNETAISQSTQKGSDASMGIARDFHRSKREKITPKVSKKAQSEAVQEKSIVDWIKDAENQNSAIRKTLKVSYYY